MITNEVDEEVVVMAGPSAEACFLYLLVREARSEAVEHLPAAAGRATAG